MNKIYPLILSVLVLGLAPHQIDAAATLTLPHASSTNRIGNFFTKTHATVTLENSVCGLGALLLLRNVALKMYATKLRHEHIKDHRRENKLEALNSKFAAVFAIGVAGAAITVSLPPTVGALKALARFSLPTARQIAPLAVALTGLLALSREKIQGTIYTLWKIHENGTNNLRALTKPKE